MVKRPAGVVHRVGHRVRATRKRKERLKRPIFVTFSFLKFLGEPQVY